MNAVEKVNAIIVDLDGTLCNSDHRKHLVENKNWNDFYNRIPDDPINEWCSTLVSSMLECHHEIIFVTGRPEQYRKLTERWLKNHLWSGFPLFMRQDGDFRKDAVIKEEIYRKHLQAKYNIIFCIEDRKQVVDMWRSLGLVCLHCAEGNF